MQITQILSNIFTQVFEDLLENEKNAAGKFGTVNLADRPDLAHYQCNGALAASKLLKQNPREIAQKILEKSPAIIARELGSNSCELSIAGPGFINIRLSDDFLASLCEKLHQDSRHGLELVQKKRKVIVDFGGPNVAKAMHVGHLRSSIIGDSIVRIHRLAGDEVVGDNHFGDWGTQMGMLLMKSKEKFDLTGNPQAVYFDENYAGSYPSESPVSLSDLEEMYPAASAKYKTDDTFKAQVLKATDELQQGRRGYRALWQHFVDTTISDLSKDFAKLGIVFDTWLGESFYEDKMPPMIERLKAKGITQVSEGALTIPLADEKQPEMPPVILVKTGGGYLYHTSDLATIVYRKEELKADLVLYIVDKRQSLHFDQVFQASEKAGFNEGMSLKHIPFGTMNGLDGKPFKTRSGGVLKLKDLIEQITEEARKRLSEIEVDRGYEPAELEQIAQIVGIATLRFADLKHNRAMDYTFDLEKFARFEGHTGPYLLYATVRIKSILRKATENDLKPGPISTPLVDSERKLMLEFLKFGNVFENAYVLSEPHHLCDYGFNLSQVFNSFYKDCHILRETDPVRQASLISLCMHTLGILETILGLLGISLPERM